MQMIQRSLIAVFSWCRELRSIFIWFCLISAVVFLSGCGSDPLDDLKNFFRDPNIEPVRATIKTAVPLAHIAAVSMAAVQGESLSQITALSNTCSSYPCVALITMELNPTDIPFDFAGGTVSVIGLWSSANQAILTALFLDEQPGVPFFKVSQVATFPVIATQLPVPGYKIVYADIDIDIDSDPRDLAPAEIQAEYDRLQQSVSGDPEINISMDAWVIQLADAGTSDVFTDDSYSISGGGQYIDINSTSSSNSAGIFQLGLVGASVSHACSHNPTSGLAFIQEVGTGSAIPLVASALLEFNAPCNSAVKVLAGFGNYISATGSLVPLDLDAP